MTDYKGCDLHDKPFPSNMVPAENCYTITVSQPATINKHKGHKEMSVDVCSAHFKELVLNRLASLQIKPKWSFTYWATYKKEDGTEGRKPFTDDIDNTE